MLLSHEPVAAPQTLPLSFGQQGILLAKSRCPPGALNIHAAFPLDPSPAGAGEVEELLRTLQARNDVFRSGVVARAGRPQMRFWPAADTPAIGLVTDGRSGLGSWAYKPFGRKESPLTRAQITERDGGTWLRLATDGLVLDSWSIGLMTREISAVWQAMHGGPALLAPLGSFSAYLESNARLRTPQAADDYRRFWSRELDHDATLDVPLRDDDQSYHLLFALPTAISRHFPALRQQLKTTDFCLFVSAFAEALGRLSGQDSLVVYSEVADRTTPETLETIGALVNNVGVRVVTGRTLEETVRSCQLGMMRAMQHQAGPLFEIETEARLAGAIPLVTPHGYLADETHAWRDNCAAPTSVRARMAQGAEDWTLEPCGPPTMGDISLGYKPASWGYVVGLIFRGRYITTDMARQVADDMLASLGAVAARQAS